MANQELLNRLKPFMDSTDNAVLEDNHPTHPFQTTLTRGGVTVRLTNEFGLAVLHNGVRTFLPYWPRWNDFDYFDPREASQSDLLGYTAAVSCIIRCMDALTWRRYITTILDMPLRRVAVRRDEAGHLQVVWDHIFSTWYCFRVDGAIVITRTGTTLPPIMVSLDQMQIALDALRQTWRLQIQNMQSTLADLEAMV